MSFAGTGKIWMNGRFVEWKDATIHIASHVIHYGSGVFEGARCYDTPRGSACFRLDEHLVRLVNSAKIYRMGLERVTAVLQQKNSNYDTDVFAPLLQWVGELAGIVYGASEKTDIPMRVVADHARATTFLIADGVLPSNEWRGYVLRKIMRRAMRHGKHLGLNEPFLHQFVAVLAREMGDAYPELRTNRAMIEQTIVAEEKRFDAVLTDGLPKLEAEIGKALETPDRVLSGDAAFRLYDTFGVPFDFIEDTAATNDVRVDKAGYDRAMMYSVARTINRGPRERIAVRAR